MSKQKRPLPERMADLAAQALKLSGEAFSQGKAGQAQACRNFARSIFRTLPESTWPPELLSNPDLNPAILTEEEKAWENFDKLGKQTETMRTQSAKPNPPGNAPRNDSEKGLFHEDCKTKLRDGYCPMCRIHPDMQSTFFAHPDYKPAPSARSPADYPE